MAGVFITATDTDAGKTIVTAALLRCLLQRGIRAVAYKPIQSGCAVDAEGNRTAPDVDVYQRAIADLPPAQSIAPATYLLTDACSPHLAAANENTTLSLDVIAETVATLEQNYDVVLVEGAGGLFVPINDAGDTMLDLCRRLDFAPLLVVPNRLGAINHTLLSFDALSHRGLAPLGFVANPLADEADELATQVAQDNIKTIERLAGQPCLAALPYVADLDGEDASFERLAAAISPVADAMAVAPDGLDLDELLAWDREHVWHPYTSLVDPLPTYLAASTKDCCITLAGGKSLIDGMSSWWCASGGYNRPELIQAAIEQLHTMPHVMFGGLTHAPAVGLAKQLVALTPKPLDKVFLADSGSVAVEVAMKMAIQNSRATGEGKHQFLTFAGGYHGDTMGAMSVCDPDNGMHALFGQAVAKNIFLPRPERRFDEPCEPADLAHIRDAFDEHYKTLAGVIVEPIVQGAGGMWFYHPDYLRCLRECCDEYGLPLIFDEIATGFGRTGKLFALEWAQVCPDILCVGKAITGGMMNLAATLCTGEIAHGISAGGEPFMHGPTYMGNPLACAVAERNLALLDTTDTLARVATIEKQLQEELLPLVKLPSVQDVRVLGAIGVVEMCEPVDVATMQHFFVEHGVWIRPFGRLVYLMPPFTIQPAQLRTLCSALAQAVQ